MLIFQVFILGVLLAIFIQDIKSRSVYWFWFPLLIVLFTALGLYHLSFLDIIKTSLINSAFILVQLLILSVYFSIKERRFVNITQHLLGWGDILFLASICWYFSTLNFIVFYIFSLMLIVLGWFVVLLFQNKNTQIPLAGLQSMIFIVCLITDWTSLKLDLTSDAYLLNYLYK